MIFRTAVATFALLACFCPGLSAGEMESPDLSVGEIALARPLVLRSDFSSREVLQRLFVRSKMRTPEAAANFVGRHPSLCGKYFHRDYISACVQYVRGGSSVPPVPQLKNGNFCEIGLGFDAHGGPRFQNVLMEKPIHFWETEFLGDYRGEMNKYMARMVCRNPEKFRGVLSEETIKQYESWVKTGKGPLNNPVLANGERCEFHHDVGSKRILVVSQNEHRGQNTLPSKGHGSGSGISGGGNVTWGQPHPFGEIVKVSALRWGGMAGTDLLASTLSLAIAGCDDKSQYIANAGSVGAAFLVATLTESLIVYVFPLSAGTTPVWLGILGVSAGGPAAWVATGVYMGVRYAVMYGWNEYQLAQALRLENACRKAERDARVWALTQSISQNTKNLEALISVATP